MVFLEIGNIPLMYFLNRSWYETLITMVFLVIGNIPLMYFLNRSWYETLMFTTVGQIILAVTAALIFVSTALVIRLTKPLEYRR